MNKTHLTLSLGAILLLLPVAIPTHSSPPEKNPPHLPVTKSSRKPPLNAATSPFMNLTSAEALDQLPGTVPAQAEASILFGTESPAGLEIYRQLGIARNEEALDLILQKYPKSGGIAYAITFALMGWMENDPDAAIAAFRSMLTPNLSFPATMHWKGRNFHASFA